MSFLTHPDYLVEPRAREVYQSLLDYLRQVVVRERLWSTLPGEVDRWWRARNQMRLVPRGEEWEIRWAPKAKSALGIRCFAWRRLAYELADALPQKVM